MKLQRLRPNAILPRRATPQSAGYDLCACLDAPVTLQPGEAALIPTGWAVDPERADCAVFVFARSGLASKHGLAMSNGVGVVDADYRGELTVPLRNYGAEPYTLTPNERFAQMVLMPVLTPELEECEHLSETERGENGFGSSGSRG